MARQPKKPTGASDSPIVALAERAREAGATHAVVIYRTEDGRRYWNSFEGTTHLEVAGLISMVLTDIALEDLPE